MWNKDSLYARSFVALVLLLLCVPVANVYAPIMSFVRQEIGNQHSVRGLRHAWGSCWAEARQQTGRDFLFHEDLRRWLSRIKFFEFESTTSQDVQKKTERWLFLTSKEERRCMHHSHPFSEGDLEAWGRVLEGWRVKLAERNIFFLVVVAPDKHTIYDQFAPVRNHHDSPSRLDQLYEYLRKKTSVQFVDVRQALWSERDARQLYYQTDTHWNEAGAFLAFQEIAKALRPLYPAIPQTPLDAMVQEHTDRIALDLARIAGVEDVVKENLLIVHSEQTAATTAEVSGVGAVDDASRMTPRVNTQNPTGAIPRLLMLRDSFGTALLPFVAAQAQKATFLWSGQLDFSLVDQERPSVLIFEIVERNLQVEEMRPKTIP